MTRQEGAVVAVLAAVYKSTFSPIELIPPRAFFCITITHRQDDVCCERG